MATEETTITELELAEEVLADMVIPVDTSTDTKSVSLKQLRAWLGSSLPTGFIIASFGKMDDERFTLLDGKTLSKQGTYGAFCAKVEEQVQAGKWYACSEEEYNADLLASGQCSKFVIGVDYVRIPKLGNSLCSGVVDGKIPVFGNGMALGLTNGTNNSGLWAQSAANTSTLVANKSSYGKNVGSETNVAVDSYNQNYGVTTDPTKSGIEGKINSVEVFYYMVISTKGQTASVEIDINQVYEDLNLKANSDLSNVASVAKSFKEQSVGWGIPDYDSMVSLDITSKVALFWVAPCDCFVHISTQSTGHCVASITEGKSGVSISRVDNTNTQSKICSATAFIDKGREINIMGTGTINYCYYAPLKGVN